MSRYEWIIFDADGTLFDYDQAEISALRGTFRDYGLVFDSRIHRQFVEINGRLWQELEQGIVSSEQLRVRRFEELAKTEGLEIPASRFSTDYLRNLGHERALIRGAEKVVTALSRVSRLVVATNGIADVQRARFLPSPIQKYFDLLVISDEIGYAKPAPEFFQYVFDRMGNPERSNVLMVGDSMSSDIAGGAGFGIPSQPSQNQSDSEPNRPLKRDLGPGPLTLAFGAP